MSQYQPMYDSFQRVNQERFVPTTRMNIAASVSLDDPIMDEVTGQVKQQPPRRRRTQAMEIERRRLEKEESDLDAFIRREEPQKGLRVDWRIAALMICVVFFAGGMFLLGLQGEVQKRALANEAVIAQGRAVYNETVRLQEEIEAKLDVANIGSAAVNDLNLVRAVDSEAVHLLAVDTRPMGKGNAEKQVAASAETVPQAQAAN